MSLRFFSATEFDSTQTPTAHSVRVHPVSSRVEGEMTVLRYSILARE